LSGNPPASATTLPPATPVPDVAQETYPIVVAFDAKSLDEAQIADPDHVVKRRYVPA
jgi:hypothetical protein